MDIGALERLGERIRQSRQQEASITKDAEAHSVERQAETQRELHRKQNLDRGFGFEWLLRRARHEVAGAVW